MQRKQAKIGFQRRRKGVANSFARQSNAEWVLNHRPLESGADTAADVISSLIVESRHTAASVLQKIAEDLAAQERIVLFEYLRTPAIKQVAVRLGKQDQTIRNQLSAIREKLAAHSLCDLLRKVLLAHMAYELARPVTPKK